MGKLMILCHATTNENTIFVLFRSGVGNLNDIRYQLDETSKEADDAETIAHDALASIDARAAEITRNMKAARDLQKDNEDLKFSIDATRKALADIEAADR